MTPIPDQMILFNRDPILIKLRRVRANARGQ